MPPKKKGGKRKDDDWDADMGESIDPIAAAAEAAKADEAKKEEEEETGGALMAALRNRKGKKGKKNQNANDFVEGEEAPGADEQEPEVDFASKAPQEANMEDEDVFSAPAKKIKGGKGGKAEPTNEEPPDEEDEKTGGGLKSKKEKEREKKEREKQRKKEQVCEQDSCNAHLLIMSNNRAGCQKKDDTRSRKAGAS